MESKFRIGIISSTHGLAGEVKLYPTTDSLERFKKLKDVLLETGDGFSPFTVKSARFSKGMVILKFGEISHINEAERLKGASVWVTREKAAPLSEGSYYIADIIGSEVVTDTGRRLGRLTDVIPTGANDVFVVKSEDDHEKKEWLLPNIRECVLSVLPEEQKIIVHLMDGLEEL